MPRLAVVGLPNRSVRESLERVRTALVRVGYAWPTKRVTVNLAPAAEVKDGTAFDLPIALAVLAASGEVPAPRGWLAVGELGLGGSLRAVPGGYAIGLLAREEGLRLLAPRATAEEAARVVGCAAHAVDSLEDAARALGEAPPVVCGAPLRAAAGAEVDLSEVRGQARARRALEIAAAGGHNLLLIGPPGAGKTLLARALPGILPAPTRREVEEIARIASARGDLVPDAVARPFRSPHPSASLEAIVGGGSRVMPGEVTRAHNGVLLFDEIAEFRRDVLEALRGPLETGWVDVARASGAVRLPARFLFVATMNPCRCGYLGDPAVVCRCPAGDAARYRARISGPILDRIDLMVFVPRPSPEALLGPPGEPSAVVRSRVEAARRFRRAHPPPAGLEDFSDAARRRFVRVARHRRLSPRALARLAGVARTIAALQGASRVSEEAVAEAAFFHRPNPNDGGD